MVYLLSWLGSLSPLHSYFLPPSWHCVCYIAFTPLLLRNFCSDFKWFSQYRLVDDSLFFFPQKLREFGQHAAELCGTKKSVSLPFCGWEFFFFWWLGGGYMNKYQLHQEVQLAWPESSNVCSPSRWLSKRSMSVAVLDNTTCAGFLESFCRGSSGREISGGPHALAYGFCLPKQEDRGQEKEILHYCLQGKEVNESRVYFTGSFLELSFVIN